MPRFPFQRLPHSRPQPHMSASETASDEGPLLPLLEWMPGLHHGDMALGAILPTMPGFDPDGRYGPKIPWIVRLMENPASPLASPGAITLAHHDAVHIILGRGMAPEDEAFVVGFTNGSATEIENWQTWLVRCACAIVHGICRSQLTAAQRDRQIRDWQYGLFEWVAQHLYPKAYRFGPDELLAFRLGYGSGEGNPVRDIQSFAFEEHLGTPVEQLRQQLGISLAKLEAIYRFEKLLLKSDAANRLDANRSDDHARLTSSAHAASLHAASASMAGMSSDTAAAWLATIVRPKRFHRRP